MKAKKIVKITLKVILIICLVIVVLFSALFVGFGFFGTMDAGPYGGYKVDIARCYEDTFEELLGRELTEDDLLSIAGKMVGKREKESFGMENIYTGYIDDDGVEYKLMGKRKFGGRYDWKIIE